MCFESYRNQILCLWPRGQEVIWGATNVFQKECFIKFFVSKMKKTLDILSQKLLYRLRFR